MNLRRIVTLAMAGMMVFSVANAKVVEQSFSNQLSLMRTTYSQGKEVKTLAHVDVSAKYPKFTLKNKVAEEKINTMLRKAAMDACEITRGIDEGDDYYLSSLAVTSEVMREDSKYISVVMTFWSYNEGAAHGNYAVNTFTFDAKTGELLPFEHFVRMNKEDVEFETHEHLMSIDDSPIKRMDYTTVTYPVTRFYVDKKDNVYLLFDPYEMAPYAAGVTHVKLTPKQIKNYNNNGPRG